MLSEWREEAVLPCFMLTGLSCGYLVSSAAGWQRLRYPLTLKSSKHLAAWWCVPDCCLYSTGLFAVSLTWTGNRIQQTQSHLKPKLLLQSVSRSSQAAGLCVTPSICQQVREQGEAHESLPSSWSFRGALEQAFSMMPSPCLGKAGLSCSHCASDSISQGAYGRM